MTGTGKNQAPPKPSALTKALIRFFDLSLALFLLPLGLGAFILILAPQLVCFREIFYVSIRTSQGGRQFRYVKLKSMAGVPAGSGRAYLETGRIPPWGRFLRKTHLDEIPELFFILAGSQSFVGPRPLLPEHAALVDSPDRRGLKTGWTGLSQVFLKTRGALPSRIQRRLDQKLAQELNPLIYLKILWATLFALPRRPMSPGPTAESYRRSLQSRYNEH